MNVSVEKEPLLSFCRTLQKLEELLEKLPSIVKLGVEDVVNELRSRFFEHAIIHLNPADCDDVRKLDPALRGQALVYLLNRYGRINEEAEAEGYPSHSEMDRWQEWLYDLEGEDHAAEILADDSIKSPRDLVHWFRQRCPR